MVKYKVAWGNITEYNVSHETEETVTYYHPFFQRNLKESKKSSRRQWFDTWDEARQYLIDKATEEVDYTKARYNKATIALENAKAMRKP